MNTINKDKIFLLRKRKMSVKDIAYVLNLHEKDIKVVVAETKDEMHRICPMCGKEFVADRPKQRFCSEKCRTRYWNQHHDLFTVNNKVEHTCLICGKKFIAYSSKKALYCSLDCYHESRKKKYRYKYLNAG